MKSRLLIIIGIVVSLILVSFVVYNFIPMDDASRDFDISKETKELQTLQQMPCDKIIQRNTEGEYHSSDNREFAREKTLDCSDIEEFFAVNASCEELYERYHSGQEYWFEDHEKITENRLAKCSMGVENEK